MSDTEIPHIYGEHDNRTISKESAPILFAIRYLKLCKLNATEWGLWK